LEFICPDYPDHKEATMSKTSISYRRGWTVALAGTAINLALGVLYAWSIFKGAITDSIKAGGAGAFTWNLASVNDPYALACLVFAFSMIIAGRMQDKIGPRATCIIGGLLVCGGFLVASLSTNYWMWILGFGVMFGLGMGFGYSAATPPGAALVPAGQDRFDCRDRGFRFRPGSRLHRPAGQLPARCPRHSEIDDVPRHRLRHRHLPVRHVAEQSAVRLRR
jgi:hypothetical protein